MTVEFSSDITAELVDFMGGDLRIIQAARVSTSGERYREIEEMSKRDLGLVKYLMRERHGSPFESSVFTFFLKAPIFVFREVHRHRIASYSEESARYRELKPLFYAPDADRKLVQEGKPGAYTFVKGEPLQHAIVDNAYRESCETAYDYYKSMLNTGIAREVARGVLPVNIYSTCYMTINARSLMNFLSLRRNVEGSTYPSYPQREIEFLAEDMERVFQEKMPVTHEAFTKYGRVSP